MRWRWWWTASAGGLAVVQDVWIEGSALAPISLGLALRLLQVVVAWRVRRIGRCWIWRRRWRRGGREGRGGRRARRKRRISDPENHNLVGVIQSLEPKKGVGIGTCDDVRLVAQRVSVLPRWARVQAGIACNHVLVRSISSVQGSGIDDHAHGLESFSHIVEYLALHIGSSQASGARCGRRTGNLALIVRHIPQLNHSALLSRAFHIKDSAIFAIRIRDFPSTTVGTVSAELTLAGERAGSAVVTPTILCFCKATVACVLAYHKRNASHEASRFKPAERLRCVFYLGIFQRSWHRLHLLSVPRQSGKSK